MASSVNGSLRIMLVEDHETVREGLRLLIDHQPDMTVVARGEQRATRPFARVSARTSISSSWICRCRDRAGCSRPAPSETAGRS